MTLAIGKFLATAPALVAFAIAWAAVEAIERLQCYRQARRERAQLLALDDRELRDLGLSRVDALQVAERPAWRDCARRRRAVP